MTAENKSDRREQKKLQTRRAILSAAAEKFSQKGVKDTSIAEIMAAAGLGLGTFYNYFNSKEQVLAELINPLVKSVETEIDKMKAAGATSAEILRAAGQKTAVFIDKNRFVLQLLGAAAEHSAVPEGKTAHVKPPGFKPIFETIIKEGQKAAEIRDDISAEAITEMFHVIYQAAAISRMKMTFAENVAIKLTILLDGIKKQ